MSPVVALFKKEVHGFIFSPNFMIVCALVATTLTWIYPMQLKMFQAMSENSMYAMGAPPQQMNIHYGLFLRNLSYLNLLLIIIVPALTMKLFSEEKKLRTFDLLLTCPIKSWHIVAGKYFAALAVIAIIIGIAFLYPAFTGFFAQINWVTLIAAFVGIFLVSSVYAAMNLFCSALTESAIIAFVMAVIFNISIWFLGMGVEIVDSPWARATFEHISLNTHLSSLVEGTIRSSSLIFFASLIFLFCFLSERVVESTRWR